MAVGVDQAGQEGAALAVEAEAGPLRLLAALVEPLDLAVVADQHRSEADQPPVGADRIAVDVVDEHVGDGGLRRSTGRPAPPEAF